MKRIAFIVMMLVGCLTHPNEAKAQSIKDAFVLVDVSGSMKYSQINSEAKQIISSMLQGNFNLSNFSGWSRVTTKGLDGNCPLISNKNTSLVSNGGKVCILPFGNMNRVKDYRFVDMSDFDNSFNSYFPTVFRDQWTYITLAKAYAVNVASENGISGMVYMIIYSDGAEESMDGTVGYSGEFRGVVDYFGTQNDSFCQKKGIIRKVMGNKQFDIEIWTMGPIPMTEIVGPKSSVVESKKIEISNQPNGKSPKSPIEINVEEPFTIRWKNANGKTGVNVQRKKGDTYTNIPVNDKDNYYTLEKKASSATITFYEAQDYKIIVGDSNGRDERYISVKSNWISDIFPIILIVILVIGGVLLWRLLSKPKTNNSSGWNTNNGSSRNNNTNHKDDW